jgi:NADH-quinone oxidoreductase subunit F
MAYDATFHKSARTLTEPGAPFAYTDENKARFDAIVKRYPDERRRSAVLPALYLVQYQQGYITANAMRYVAGLLGITAADVEDVVSYYTMFYTRPMGKYVINVCRTLSCALNGAERVTAELCDRLGIRPGQTDPTGTFTLVEVECLGACDRAPVALVNDSWHECLSPENVPALLDGLRARGEAALSGCHHVIEGHGSRSVPDPGPATSVPAPVRPLTGHVREPGSFALDFYLKNDGYDGLKKALAMAPDQVIEMVKASGLRGRGGAGFPTGMKWQFVDKKSPNPKYIACNADESEPGTFKDHLLMERNPHLVIEGCAIACYAIGARVAYIYIRGEFLHVQHVLEDAIREAYERGFLGRNVLGSGFTCDVYIHRGAGAYEAGEETALLESLEGKRAQPRNKPPFPAVIGLYNCPTAVNNVETLANVPLILRHGAEWFAALGPEKNGGPKLYCVSGHVQRPGVYEAPMTVTLRELIEGYAGGVGEGRTLKAVIPGGSSVPILMPDQLDTQASFDGVQKAGSLLGSAGIIVLDDTTCMVWLAENLLHFYRHESCGKCTPCREGTDWLHKILRRLERGEGQMRDLDLLSSISGNIAGKTLCAFGDAAVTPILTTLKHFRREYEAHIREGRCTLAAPWRSSPAVGAH